jgi:hypothetical protein
MKIHLVVGKENNKKFGNHGGTLSFDHPAYSWFRSLKKINVSSSILTVPKQDRSKDNLAIKAFKKGYNYVRRKRLSEIVTNKIIERTSSEEKEVVLFSGNNFILSRAQLKKISNRNNILILQNGLSLKWHGSEKKMVYIEMADINVVISEGQVSEYHGKGIGNALALPSTACCSYIHAGHEREIGSALCDVGFVGSLSGRLYSNRRKILRALTGYDLGIWTPASISSLRRWGLDDCYMGEVSRSGCPEIYRRCKIMVNMPGAHRDVIKQTGNLSLFEIPASSGFQVAQSPILRNSFEPGTDVATFADISELKEQLDYYLCNEEERERMMRRGRSKALSEHTFENRFASLLNYVEESYG